MKSCLLIGCGSEIGANILLHNDPHRDGFEVTDVVTNPPIVHEKYPSAGPIHGILARLALAQPSLLHTISVVGPTSLRVGERTIRFHFLNHQTADLDRLGFFDAAILATSKEEISSPQSRDRLSKIASASFGVAEDNNSTSLYPCLFGVPLGLLPLGRSDAPPGETFFCLGSCQTHGMHASLRLVLGALSELGLDASAIKSLETDIVHPDTPTGVLGTRSFEGRMQDCRNNLRPSFSQLPKGIAKVLPSAHFVATVSLRAPVPAPGYQINRFLIQDEGSIHVDHIRKCGEDDEKLYPTIVAQTHLPFGSLAYSSTARCSTLLSGDNHLIISRPKALAAHGLSEVILQSFVSNTLGYAANTIAAVTAHLRQAERARYFASV